MLRTVSDCISYVEAHMEVRHATKNGAYTAGRKIKPAGAVNHSVGCAQPKAEVFFGLMNDRNAKWGVHAILGDFHLGEGKIILCLDLKMRPWGCGSGKKGSWNNSKIQWEVCEPAGHTYAGGTMIAYDVQKNQGYFERMWKMLVAWNVYCVVQFGYPVSCINDHSESYAAGMGSNHSDMMQWLPKHGKSMDALRAEVLKILENKEDDEMDLEKFKELFREMRQELRDNDSSNYSAEAREWAVRTGLIAGSSAEEFNGMWEDFLTREQLVTVLFRFAQMMGKA